MATRANLTVDFNDLLGAEVSRISARLVTNLPSGAAVMDETNKTVNLGSGKVAVGQDGKATISLIPTDSTDLNIAANTLQYRLTAEAAVGGDRVKFDSGWFAFTAAADITELDLDVPGVTPSWRSGFTAEMEAIWDESAANLAQQEAIAGADTADDLITALDANPASDFRVQQDARLLATIAAESTNPAKPVVTYNDARYLKQNGAVALLPAPMWVAHRGGAGIAPEETMEAFRTSVALGSHGLEMDCQPLSDGALALMHDATVDATTEATGPVSGYTAPSWRTLNAAYRFAWAGKSVPPALLSEVLAEFGGKVALWIEPKDVTNADTIMDLCEAQGLKGSVILECSTLPVLQAATARGFYSYFWWSGAVGTGVSVASAVSNGADFLGLNGVTRPDAEVTTLVATGKPVVPYTVDRRVRATQLLALGCAGIMTDQPQYARTNSASRTLDSWRQGVPGHGLLAHGTTGSPTVKPATVTGGALELPVDTSYAVIPGELCPVGAAAGSYTIDFEAGWAVIPSGSEAVSLDFAVADDDPTIYGTTNPVTGYRAYIRKTGVCTLYRLTGGVPTQLGTQFTTTAFSTPGALGTFKITVTPTTVRFQRIDDAGDSGAVTDSTYRGGYMWLVKANGGTGTPRFKTLTIT